MVFDVQSHLALRTSDVKLWRSMARIHGKITRSFNRRHGVFGPSWQGRYKARLVQNPDDLRNLLAYIHLNPVMAGLVDDPSSWEFSGHQAMIGQAGPVLVDVDSALLCFEGESREEARQAYFGYLRCVAETKWARKSIRCLPWWRTARDDNQTVSEKNAPPQAKTFDDKYPDALQPACKETAERLLGTFAPILGVPQPEICGPRKKSETVIARKRFTFIAVHFLHYSLRSIARTLNKTPSHVGRWLAMEIEAYYNDSKEAERIDSMVSAVMGNEGFKNDSRM